MDRVAQPMTSPDQTPLADRQLVEQALAGDERAYRALVQRYEGRVFQQNFQMVGDWDEADSLTHHTFIRAFRGLKGFDAERKFSNWLLQIARNAALSRLEKKSVTVPIEGSFNADTPETRRYPALQVSALGESPLQALLSQELSDQIRRAMAQLRPQHREALMLDLEGFPHREIAQHMGIPINTVRTYVLRARTKLEELMKEEDGTE